MTSFQSPGALAGEPVSEDELNSVAGTGLPRNNCIRLAEFACGLQFGDIPRDVVEKEKDHLLDGIGNGLCGAASDFGRRVLRYVAQLPASGESVLWGTRQRAGCMQAALANASFSNYGELEDAHFRTKFKPNTCLTPAAIAVAEKTGMSGEETLAALIAANEVCLRIATATRVGTDGYARGWISTSSIGAFGAAIVTGRALGFDVDRMAHALALAGAQPCGIWSGGMAMSKRVMIGKAAENGISAALMANEGITGGFDVFDGEWGSIGDIISSVCEREILTKDLGQWWITREIGLECYPTKGGAHSAIDCVLEILSRGALDTDQIDDILVRATTGIAGNRALRLFPPTDFYEAQNSLGYILGITLIDGACGMEQFTDAKIADQRVLALGSKVRIQADAEADKLSPKTKTTFVDITMRDGRLLTSRVDYCKGEPENPLTRDELNEKFKRAARPALDGPILDDIIDTVARLDRVRHVADLARLLLKA